MAALTKTWDRPEYADSVFADLRVFNVFRRQRENGSHGGVALVVRKSSKAFRRSDFEMQGVEFLVVELCALPVIFGVFYGPPVHISEVLPTLISHNRKCFSCEDSEIRMAG